MATVSRSEDGRTCRVCPCGPTTYSEVPPGPVCYGSEIQTSLCVADEQSAVPECIAREWDFLTEALGLGHKAAGTDGAEGSHKALFPQLKWAAVEKANTLMKVKALPAVKALTHIFSEAGFAPSVNFNAGSGELSLTIPLFCREGHVPMNAQQAVVCVMLAACPEQVALEQMYAAHRERCVSACESEPGESSDLLGNRCLEVFAKQTGVGIWQRTVLPGSRAMKVSFAQLNALAGPNARKMLRYSPCYSMLLGFRNAASYSVLRQGSPHELQAALDEARERLISDMQSCFWESVAAFPYVATASLRQALGEELRAYLGSGLGDPAGGFLPSSQAELSFFLLGGAGTGKSTLVAAFAQALQATLCRFVDTRRRVDVVKVPLNGLTPESLGMILRVQGISDMSIERLLEQSLQRGSSALLHLEEIPEDPALQEALVSTVKGMLSTLLGRYRQYAGNVLLALTSNYPPAAAVARCATLITVEAPSAEEQWQHCVSMLETSLRGATQAAKVSVELKYALPHMDDMRPLHQWWTTLSYHIARRVKHLVSAQGSEAPPRSISASLSSANGGGMIIIGLEVDVGSDSGEQSPPNKASNLIGSDNSGQDEGVRRRGCNGTALTSAPVGEREIEAKEEDEDGARNPSIWRGFGFFSRSRRRQADAGRGSRTWWEAFMIDNDTQGPLAQGPLGEALCSPLLPAMVEAPAQERCGAACEACARVGNIWTYVDCNGIGRDRYLAMPRPCPEPAMGVDGSEHVLAEELPAMHSRTNSFDSDKSIAVEDDALLDVGAASEHVLTVSSMNGFFFVEGDGGDWGCGGSEADRFRRRKNATIVKMCLAGIFKPGVVVLTGPDSARADVEGEILQQVQATAGEEATKVVHVELREEADKDKVNGHQSQIRGGLFKTIDDFNNQNVVRAGGEGILVIVCRVNETGQYMLRELLETNGESRTHRFAIRKDRVLFVLSVQSGARVQEMTISRSHALIECPAPRPAHG